MKKENGKKQKTRRENIDMSNTIMYDANSDEITKTKQYKITRNKKRKTKKEKKKKRFKWLKRIILTFFILGILAVLVVAGIIIGIFTSDKYKLTADELIVINENSTVLDSEGNGIATITGTENRKIVTIEQMPKELPEAFIAIEDERFYEHKGVDIKRTLYAIVMYVKNKGASDGGGGSTITQQLIKNTKSDNADSGTAGIERKIREMARAYNVEKILSKTQILEAYLNRIPMGSTVYGVGMAAEYYFNKSVSDLDLAECAFIAGINHAPSGYNPFIGLDNAEKIKNRTKEVLFQMKDQEKISQEQYEAAVEKVEAGLPFNQGAKISRADYSYHTQAAIKEVISDLMKEKGISRDEAELLVSSNGYTIYTTQNSSIQARMKEEFEKDKYIRSGNKKDSNGNLINAHTQAAMVIIDHKTGQVVATMGGLGTDASTVGINRATETEKQTGSSIKPLACEAPALERGVINPGTVYDDSPTSFGSYTPHNSGGYGGLITIRSALARSSNIVHVKIMKELGPANSRAFLATLGINVPEIHESLPMALGTADVSVLNMAAAYAAIANNGVYIEPTFYTKVVDSKGNVILEKKQETRKVMSEENAYVLQNLLKAPVASGTAGACAISGMDVGAKTGSTNDFIDRWLCGFTPYYAAATWFGFDYSESPVFSDNNARTIWAAVMKDVHKNLAGKRFEKPSNVVYVRICEDSGCVATDSCTRTISEVFVKGTIPSQCQGHKTVKICKQTGKVATEYCKDVEEKTIVEKPAKEKLGLWSTNAGDKYNVPTETCDVHKGPEKVKMVNVEGDTLSEAKEKIEKLGLKVEIKYGEDTKKNDGIVLTQSVNKDAEIEKGKTVTLTINKITNKGDNKTNTEKTNTQIDTKTNTQTNTNASTNTVKDDNQKENTVNTNAKPEEKTNVEVDKSKNTEALTKTNSGT